MQLLYVASVGLVVTSIFPGDVNVPHPPATITGLIHWIAAGTSFLSIMIAAFLLSYCFTEDERWQSFHQPALVSAFTAVAALAVFGTLVLIGWVGIGERIYITASLLWLLFTAIQLESHVSENWTITRPTPGKSKRTGNLGKETDRVSAETRSSPNPESPALARCKDSAPSSPSA